MKVRYPLAYTIQPQHVSPGRHWLTISLKNLGAASLTALDVRLNSLDAYSLNIYKPSHDVAEIASGARHELQFQVLANATAQLYLTADGRREGQPFHWETPGVRITVGQEVARLTSLFVLNAPYVQRDEHIRCEATIQGLRDSQGLELQFWADTPSGDLTELAAIDTKALKAGEWVRYIAEFIPQEAGLYTVYGYLFDNDHRIDRKTDHVYVSEAARECANLC